MYANRGEIDVDFLAADGVDRLAGDGAFYSVFDLGGVCGFGFALDDEAALVVVVEVYIEFGNEGDTEFLADGFMGGSGETVEGDTVLEVDLGGFFHEVGVASQHSVEGAVGFDVIEFHAVLVEEADEGTDLVADDGADFFGGEGHAAAAEAGEVGQAGVGADFNAVFFGESDGAFHDVGIPGVPATGEVDGINDGHEGFVVAEAVEADAFSHVGINGDFVRHDTTLSEVAGVTQNVLQSG